MREDFILQSTHTLLLSAKRPALLKAGKRTASKRCKTNRVVYQTISGVECEITYKAIKNIYLRVTGASSPIKISAPFNTPLQSIEMLVNERFTWIQKQRGRLNNSIMNCAHAASKAEIEQWRTTIQAQAPVFVSAWSQKMGVHVSELAYRNMKSSWGNCRPKTGRICLNIRLALYPVECLEYVVVHELCHLLEPSHNARFYALLSYYLPDWKSRKQKLN